MDVIAAYRDVGSYRGAAEICGTTHKTVRRIIEAHETGRRPGRAGSGVRNFEQVEGLGGGAGGEDGGADFGEAVVAAGASGRVCRLGPELPPAGGPDEGGVASWPAPLAAGPGVGTR